MNKMARWRNGDAELCKSSKMGSTPIRASINNFDFARVVEFGRHEGLKIP